MQEHQSRFKAYIIPSAKLADEAQKLAPAIEELEKSPFAPAEKVFLFIALFAESRRPAHWYQSKSKNHVGENGFANLSSHFDFLKNLEIKNLEDFTARFEFKKLPGAIAHCLAEWNAHRRALALKDKAITPAAMLEAQGRGERIVTLDWQAAREGRLVDGRRDALEFLLHDLVHADLFFAEDHREQRDFFARFQQAYSDRWISDAMRTNAEFETDIHYLMADMNSHVGHMQAHLKASLIKHQLFTENKKSHDTLSAEGREDLERRWGLLNNLLFP